MPVFNVARTIQIDSDPETVFKTFSDFSTWQTWSPWLLADPKTTLRFKGDPTKVGGGYTWDSPIVGAGEMEHLELHPPSEGNSKEQIRAQLRFLRPWKSESKVDFQIRSSLGPQGRDVTEVTWRMAGSLPFFMFWMKPLMVSMISMDYDRGLRMAKELIETGSVDSQVTVHEVTQVPPRRVIGLSGKSTLSEIGPAMEKTIAQVKKHLSGAAIVSDDKWLSLFDKMNLKTQTLDYTCGIELPKLPAGASTPPGLVERTIPEFDAMHVTHVGRYEHLGNAWFAAYQHIQSSKRKPASKLPGLELYANSPDNTPAEKLITEVYVPLR